MQPLYLCADVGGTQIKTALLTAEGALAAPIGKAPARADLPREPMLEHLTACLLAAAENTPAGAVQGVRLAVPGPFDYPAGICKIEGLAKYGALYGVDLRAELGARLAARLGAAAGDIRFQNDVAAFALGELRFGCAKGAARGVFVCIGTGCGSAFTLGEDLAPAGTPGMPTDGYIYPLPLRGKRIDDWLSRRGLQTLSGEMLGEQLDGLALARRADAGDAGAQAVWQEFGALLAEALTPVLDAYRPALCCLGGQVTASGARFLPPLQAACAARGVALACTRIPACARCRVRCRAKSLHSLSVFWHPVGLPARRCEWQRGGLLHRVKEHPHGTFSVHSLTRRPHTVSANR